MKSRETALRLKRFDAQERARKVQGLEQMIKEFEVVASDLQRQVQAEEDRTGVKDIGHFAYSTYAKAASQRRDKLRASIEDLRAKLDEAIKERDEAGIDAVSELQIEPRDGARHRRRIDRGLVALAR